jgi:hypothetical protein
MNQASPLFFYIIITKDKGQAQKSCCDSRIS